MAIVFATSGDVAVAMMRALSPAETAWAEQQLSFATAMVRERVPDVDTRVSAGSLDRLIVKGVVVAMVTRVLKNPDGTRSTSTARAIDDYREERTTTTDQALSDGVLRLTDDELALLRSGGARRGAFSIAPSQPVTTEADLATVAAHRARRDPTYSSQRDGW